MTLVNAIQVLFAQAAPAGADFAGAFDALKGKRDSDLSQADANTLGRLAETFQDFVGDPSGWIEKAKKVTAADPRHSWWAQLAQALGASVTSGPAPSIATSPSTSEPAASTAPTDPPALDIEPEQGIDPDALAGGAPPPGRRESGGGTGSGGFSISTADTGGEVDDRPKRGKKKSKDHSDGAPTGDKPDDGKANQSASTAQSIPPHDLVHGFQSVQDSGRAAGELIRAHVAAAQHETPRALQKRLDAEAVELQRRLDQDAVERQRRQMEEEEALRRRLAIEAEATEKKRLAELRLAAEKQRLDDEAEERREERKRAREEAMERKPPEPPPKPGPIIDVTSREIPEITREILAYSSYRTWSAWLIETFRLIRTSSPAEQAQKRAELPHMCTLIRTMKATQDRMEVQAGFHLERLLEVLEAGRDQREPDWFQANYVTGSY